jgi:ferrous iron transport protein A
MKFTQTIDGPKTLSGLPAGCRGIVHSLRGGRGFCSRAAHLGFTAGAPITVVQNYGHGPLLVSVRGTLVALGRTEAGNVAVRISESANGESANGESANGESANGESANGEWRIRNQNRG